MNKLLTRLGLIISLFAVSVQLSGQDTPHYTDVRSYHVRAINPHEVPAIPGITAKIIHGGTTATLSAPWPGVNNDGVVIFGAGPAHTLSTPRAPTVTPAIASSGTGTGQVVTAPAGASSYSYEILAADSAGGYTPVGSAGSISTGGTLG